MPTIRIDITSPLHLNSFYDNKSLSLINISLNKFYEVYIKTNSSDFDKKLKVFKTNLPLLRRQSEDMINEMYKNKFIEDNLINYEYNLFNYIHNQPTR